MGIFILISLFFIILILISLLVSVVQLSTLIKNMPNDANIPNPSMKPTGRKGHIVLYTNLLLNLGLVLTALYAAYNASWMTFALYLIPPLLHAAIIAYYLILKRRY